MKEGELQIVRFGPIKCERVLRSKVNLDFCRRHCKLLGAAVCPRSPTLGEIIQMEIGDEKSGRPLTIG